MAVFEKARQKLICLKENVLLLISDAAAYMLKVGKILRECYKNIFHITCIAHLYQNCCLKIISYYKNVNDLIGSVKDSTVNSKDRRNMFKSIKLPPGTILTRFSTWLKACEYYFEYFPKVWEIVKNFKDDGMIV